jgi:putative ABC transport system ATP-binding protein
MIKAVNIQKVFNQGKPNEYTALRDVSITLGLGGATVIKGPSGSGKTTLLAILGCMGRPTAGRVFLEDREITSLPERFLAEIRLKTFGFIFQSFNLIRGLSALDNVVAPAYPTGERHASLKERGMNLLEQFGLEDRASEKVELLSGGEAQRIAICRALINNPSIIIADEPTAHLDSKLSMDFMELMAKLVEHGKTLLLASHDPLIFDAPLIDRVIEMRDGMIVPARNAQ